MGVNTRKLNVVSVVCIILIGTSSCMLSDLRNDLNVLAENYGYLRGRVSTANHQNPVLIGLYARTDKGLSLTNVRTVQAGEDFYFLVQDTDYVLYAFADTDGDFIYQPGEPAIRIDQPLITSIQALGDSGVLDYDNLQVQEIGLSNNTILKKELDLSLEQLRFQSTSAANFLRVVDWQDERFSADNVRRGMWEPAAFEASLGFGLYLLNDFNPNQKSIVLVHGVNDSPLAFRAMVERLPADYQILLFHYPSGFPLEHTSNVLAAAVEELLRRFKIPQVDVIAHSMGGLVGKGMLNQINDTERARLRNYITLATPFAGHAGAAIGTKWSPTVAPVWWSMMPQSRYLRWISSQDPSASPNHHLIFTFSHGAGGESEGDDGVVSVKSQLAYSAQRSVTGIYAVADDHDGVLSNACSLTLINAILADGKVRVAFPDC